MTDKEKKAIKVLKSSMFEYEEFDTSVFEYFDENHKIVLNLIENQQKEIEELKEDIENWKFTKEYVDNEYIHKQKIKDKIEELKKCLPDPLCEENVQWRIRELQELLEEK